jgi:two-component system response regulator PilR (NtrC family)
MILFISPKAEDADRLARMIRTVPVGIDSVGSVAEARDRLAGRRYRVILTEASLPDGSWTDVLELGRKAGTEVIVTDPEVDSRFWAEVLNLGGYDLIEQPFREPEVCRILANACSRYGAERAGFAAL